MSKVSSSVEEISKTTPICEVIAEPPPSQAIAQDKDCTQSEENTKNTYECDTIDLTSLQDNTPTTGKRKARSKLWDSIKRLGNGHVDIAEGHTHMCIHTQRCWDMKGAPLVGRFFGKCFEV